MAVDRIKATSLWQSSLAFKDGDSSQDEREELRSSLQKFRKNAEHLVSRIAAQLPGLTQHEISHLDALWETASLIAGDSYPLNPLEGFVLGGAILLHDSALCFEAFKGGINEVRATTTWKDAYAAIVDGKDSFDEEAAKGEADFAALRNLHASQAAELAEQSWIDPDTQQPIFLIENASLRKHLGQIIGQIAASHHWDIERVANTLPTQLNAPSPFPRSWRIDPVKIACLLRCADAAHIDNERAPDFLHALLKRSGLSFSHWQAQNRLANVDIDQADSTGSTLLFTSTRSFRETESESWWVAYDAITLVDKEIRSSNALLESVNSVKFQVKRVKGVESPDLLSKYIKTEGWAPCSAELHVGNVEKLVENLGGEKLYGAGQDLLLIAIRELIQNSRDAILARAALEEGFSGKITISLTEEGDSTWLSITDNGVGMSERVLTGPLLDFGTSFWTSSLVRSEFPGLRSSKFKSVGQFGIGFYSIFMIADEVHVTSKPWREGLTNSNQLIFKNGISLRPLFKRNASGTLDSFGSTQVKARLKPDTISSDLMMEIKRNTMKSVNLSVPFVDYLASICAGLDVSIYFKTNGKSEERVHQNIYDEDFSVMEWLKRISFSSYQSTPHTVNYIANNIERIKPIVENGKIWGIAAITTDFSNEQNFLTIYTVGGLASSVHARDSSRFIGFIDQLPQSARREGQNYSASESVMKFWAIEQLNILMGLNLNPVERYLAANSLCDFKVDPTAIASIPLTLNNNYHFLSFDELVQLSDSVKFAILKSVHLGDHVETYHNIHFLNGYALIRPIVNGNFLSLKMENGIPENNNSIIDCFHRALVSKGKTPSYKILQSVASASIGGMMDALIITTT